MVKRPRKIEWSGLMPNELLEFLRTKKQLTNDDIRQTLLRLLEIESDQTKEIQLTNDEIVEVKQLLADKKELVRFANTFKTAIISLASTIIAYNVFYDSITHLIVWIIHAIGG